MKRLAIAAFAMSFSSSLLSANEMSVYGLWKTEDQAAKMEIKPCPQAPQEVCGVIAEMQEPNDPETGQPKTDKNNPKESLKRRKLLGLMNLYGFKVDSDDPQHWIEGTIYSPKEGKDYSCEMKLLEGGKQLEVHGYVGIPLFGKTQVWTRTTREEKLISQKEE